MGPKKPIRPDRAQEDRPGVDSDRPSTEERAANTLHEQICATHTLVNEMCLQPVGLRGIMRGIHVVGLHERVADDMSHTQAERSLVQFLASVSLGPKARASNQRLRMTLKVAKSLPSPPTVHRPPPWRRRRGLRSLTNSTLTLWFVLGSCRAYRSVGQQCTIK